LPVVWNKQLKIFGEKRISKARHTINLVVDLFSSLRFSDIKRELRIKTVVLVVLGVLVAASIITPLAKSASSITLNPTSGPPGTTVVVTGSGFTANGLVVIYMDGALVATVTLPTISAGDISIEFTVPNDISPGPYDVVAKDLATQNAVQTTFTVQQPAPSSSSPPASPSQQHTPTPTLQPSLAVPTQILYIVAAAVGVGVATATILIIKRRRK
jgi:hypothetical protein